MNENEKLVLIVHAVDTEGPLYESFDATFERLDEIFGITGLPKTRETLDKLRNGEIDLGGIIGLHANTYAALNEAFRNIAKHFRLPCRVVQDGEFTLHASRADIVVGPMTTSAMIQCLALGKPYYPFSVRPTIDDPAYLLGCKPSSTGAEFRRALETGDALVRDAMLQYFCSSDEIGDPARRFWEVLSGETTNPG